MRTIMAALIASALPALASPQGVAPVLEKKLADFEALQRSSVGGGPAQQKLAEARRANREYIEGLIRQDKLQTGHEFALASKLYVDVLFFEVVRVAYELLLTGALLGDKEAIKELPSAWDRLHYSFGTGQRLGTATRKLPGANTTPEPLAMSSNPPPGPIRAALLDMDSTVAKAKGAKDLSELEELARTDQEDRANIKPETIGQIIANDRERLKKVIELMKSGRLTSANDYFRAGLIMQHGETIHDYSLAHECGVLAALLGHPGGRSLCSVSYDRLLLNSGHRQRFGTQLGPFQPWVDSSNLSAKERSTLMAPP